MPEISTIVAIVVCAIGTLMFLALVANAVDESSAFVKSYGEIKRKKHIRWLENNGFDVQADALRSAAEVDIPTAVEVVE